MFYVVLFSAFCGAVVTLVVQFLLVYRRNVEPVGRTVQYVKVVPDNALKDYFNTPPAEANQTPQDSPLSAGSRQPEAGSAKPPEAAVTGGSPLLGEHPETCNFLNAIFLFLFRELRDTPLVRHWLTKKIKVEFEELLQTKTAGRLLEGLSLRDISLGNSLPVFKSAKLMKPVHLDDDGMPEELNFEVELEYNGGFHLAIDVELVFGKSAYLFVKMRRVVGRLRLQFTRVPFSHWSFSFLEDPLVDFEVKSQFEGRPLPQLTSIIVNQLKRVIKKKHTLPNYKIRYKPFFPFQVQPPLASTCDFDLSVQDSKLVEGRLKVTLIECSRLFILGSYDRETYIHCTLELSSHQWKEKTRSSIKQTEVMKGPCGSVGMTFRHVPASEGDAVHVSIETVTPNSPAAMADLQRGDRLIEIGGVKVTSSVQVPKLLKQAGERVVILYERPVRNQAPPLGPLQEGFGPMEETGFIPQPSGYEEDPAPITTLSDMSDNKDLDSEFEELVVDAKSAQNSANINTTEPKEDFFLAVNQSPKRTVANLASKPLGSISPILNRKFNLSGLQSPLKTQPKETPKPSPMKTGEDLQRPSVPPPPPPPSRPPVPPRPQIRLTSASSETSLLESADPPVPVPTPAEKSPEKLPVNAVAEEKAAPKPTEAKPDAKLDAKLDEAPEGAGGAGRDSLDERTVSWESPETAFRAKSGRWPRNTAAAVLEVEAPHRFLNAALWCKDPFRPGALLCLGHASLRLEHLALECMATSSAEYQGTFRLRPPEPRASVSRTALRGLSSHKGFNEKLCYGDLTLHFCYPAEPGEPDNWPGPFGRERAGSLMDDEERERERESAPSAVAAATRDELAYGALHLSEVRHNFQDTQFQNPTWCEYCKKKVWTKAASQCMVCSYVCHKKCQDKCLAESPLCALAAAAAAERRGADPEANKSAVNRATGLTRHIINTSSRLLNLRQAQRARLAEQVQEVGGAGAAGAEPSPKHTPNTSDNESSDTETYAAGASPSKAAAAAASGKLMRKDGGLDDSVFIAVKEIGRDLYRGLPTDERSQKLELMLDKLQQEIDQELEHNNALLAEERQAGDGRRRALTAAALAKSGERLQALTLLTIHYRAGIEDLESVESTSPSEPKGKEGLEEEGVGGGTLGAEPYDGDLCSPGGEGLDDITEEQICVEALH